PRYGKQHIDIFQWPNLCPHRSRWGFMIIGTRDLRGVFKCGSCTQKASTKELPSRLLARFDR
ncbi:MAG: hypothetical protein ACETWD_05755, partial [Desulfatiglandales bacterium]